MSDLLDLHRIVNEADYVHALDELEQLVDAPALGRSSRARELSEQIAEYEARVASVIVQTVKKRVPYVAVS